MFMMGLWLIVPVLLIGVVAYALGWRPQVRQTWPPEPAEKPLDTLKTRYAKGEIDRDEYEKMRRDLEG